MSNRTVQDNIKIVISRSSVRIRLPAHSICNLRVPICDLAKIELTLAALIANCRREALEINPLEIFGT
jgi:hypothetical protein